MATDTLPALPIAAARWRVYCTQFGITLPLRCEDDGEVFDAKGRNVAQVDPWASLPDEEAMAIGNVLVRAMNTAGGYRAIKLGERTVWESIGA